eukprot:Blabericola_migrator_1__5766@NODE_2921_length_2208_cov_64_448856_g1831_i0_p1_GENE_NODE_2921_length_2208_cov_64_448856_g1831_i0NODE_2921_length_2208_cov_64_448856_g1831_i0_p1_ORF_typecomplete_len353_score54_28DNA_pol3_delta2/PF13177_6/3_9e23Rad17/PF03215_15/5_4e11RuvB_N/PF05496_12/0_00036RuvB_N/PF05496_12/2_3e02RuvB_N/PF05496_12/2_6e03AAA_30/PF13604_6/0_0012Sigma54_activ_2/PF14532_6/0_062AAA_22/PF13401_6/0_059AAA_22/PF13401_6/1e03AAA/PF00004_29/0_026DUF815/PF05673_13/0_023TsaE/PF02367_17/0_068Arf
MSELILWTDRFEPRSLDECDCHQDVQKDLKRMVVNKDIPHIIMYGPAGAGKQTRVRALLRGVYGDGVGRMKPETMVMESGFTFETMQSPFHTELYASDLGFKDRQCVQQVLKQLASNYNPMTLLPTTSAKNDGAPRYRIFVIQEAQALSTPAQAALRRTMELYSSSARLILLTERLSGLMEPLKSRSVCIRVPRPSIKDTVRILTLVCQKAGKTAPDQNRLTEIANMSRCNLRAALLMLQRSFSFKPSQPLKLSLPKWRQVVMEVCDKVRKSPTVDTVLQVREDLAHMMVKCIPSQDVLEELFLNFLSHASNPKQQEAILSAASHYVSSTCNQSHGFAVPLHVTRQQRPLVS